MTPIHRPSEGPLHAFVTGATGFLGRNLVEVLIREGWKVTALCRPGADPTGLEGLTVRWEVGDILDASSLRRAIPQGVDAVFHTAGDTSMWRGTRERQRQVNVRGTYNVARSALLAGAKRLIYTSSWSALGLDHRALHEDLPPDRARLRSAYARSKLAAEEVLGSLISEGLDVVTMHPSHILGRYDERNWVRFIQHVLSSSRPVVPPAHTSFCHAERVAEAHVAAVHRGRPGVRYLLGGADATYAEVARVVGEVMGRPVNPVELPPWLLRAAARVMVPWGWVRGREPPLTPESVEMLTANARIVSHRAEDELGYRPSTLEEMVTDTCRWLCERGWVAPPRVHAAGARTH